ncbi:hypothetical protein CFO_g5585 [Ceratocystis platani]|uniref:Uncharacterized protein n=1 Tax=Ceratocystis fimbriata f. sp. platani TaxID=88771 RepID=A0A0F8BIR7_CERFI|nr:hypothetical protein CFO_g5585 [Ceratocystis platani]
MSVILRGSNWKEWENNFFVQLQNAALHYLLQKDSMEGVERTESSDSSNKPNYTKDLEAAMSLLDLSLDKYFQTIVEGEEILHEAYQVLKDACAPDPLETAYEEYKRVLRSPLAKDKTMLQNWLYFKTVHNRCFMKGDTEKDEYLKKKRTFQQFLWQLPRGYKEVILECTRADYDISKTIAFSKSSERYLGRRKGQEDQRREKKGHLASDCWSKKKTNSDQKAQLANQNAQKNPGDGKSGGREKH